MSKTAKVAKDAVCFDNSTVDTNRDNITSYGRQRAYSMMKERNSTKVDYTYSEQMRPRTCSMPTGNTIFKRMTSQKGKGHGTSCNNTQDVETIVVRSFEVNSKGVIKSRSDSLRSRSSASFSSEGDPCPMSQSSVFSTSSSQESLQNYTNETMATWLIMVYGKNGVGKTAITQQFMTSEYLGGFNTSLGKPIYVIR